jgi:hypothetical protein
VQIQHLSWENGQWLTDTYCEWRLAQLRSVSADGEVLADIMEPGARQFVWQWAVLRRDEILAHCERPGGTGDSWWLPAGHTPERAWPCYVLGVLPGRQAHRAQRRKCRSSKHRGPSAYRICAVRCHP